MISLAAGRYAAQVNPLGGGLAALAHDGVDLIRRQDGAGSAPAFRGAVLAPWSNRVGDGTYLFGGVEHRLPINEPDRNNALHGLVLDDEWERREAAEGSAALQLHVGPVEGYPFRLRLNLTYVLDGDGLSVTLVATNTGDQEAPYGCGFHPYVIGDPDPIDDTVLQFVAQQRLRTDPQRLLPSGQAAVSGTAYDFSAGSAVGDRRLDDAFTGLGVDDDGRHGLRVGNVQLWWDTTMNWLQVFTPADRTALAVEPCTSPPDAFRTGTDLVVLAPGKTHRAAWGVCHAGPAAEPAAEG